MRGGVEHVGGRGVGEGLAVVKPRARPGSGEDSLSGAMVCTGPGPGAGPRQPHPTPPPGPLAQEHPSQNK